MGRGTGAAVALIVGAVEILDLRIALIEVKVKVAAAIGADQQAGKHIVFSIVGAALTDFAPLLLHLLIHSTLDDRLMDVLKHHPILAVIVDSLLILVGFGISFEIENVTTVFLQGENFGYCGAVPLGKGQHPSVQVFLELMSRYHISVDQILHGEAMEGKSTERMQFETLLDELTDAEIKILTATAQALLDARADSEGEN